MRLPFLAGFLLAATFLFSQNTSNLQQPTSVNTDGAAPDASAQLDVQATDKGLLTPRMTTAQRTAIATPATGLLVYDTDTGSFWFFENATWNELAPAGLPSESGVNTIGGIIPNNSNPMGLTSIITLNDLDTVAADTRFRVCVDISHIRVGDLNISLIAPDGTVIDLSSGNGGLGDDYTGTCFTTEASVSISSGAPPFTGVWLPEGNFADFVGKAITGDWELKVVNQGVFPGQLNHWSLQLSRPGSTAILLADADGDTRVTVEDLPDEDIVRIEAGGGIARLEVRTDSSVLSGQLRVVGSFVSGNGLNSPSGESSFIGGGGSSTASGFGSFIGGGWTNLASGAYSFVGGGEVNIASSQGAFIGGGSYNNASGKKSFVGGGNRLLAKSYAEAVFGTYNTDYTPVFASGFNAADRLFVIGNGTDSGNRSNAVTVMKSGRVGIGSDSPDALLDIEDGALLAQGTTGGTPISGAGTRLMWIPAKKAFRAGEVSGTQWDADSIGLKSFVGGGDDNSALSDNSFVGGGSGNTASGSSSAIIGGFQNDATNNDSFIGGGKSNTVSGLRSFVGGGNNNDASDSNSFVGGGESNDASGSRSFVGGGFSNDASGLSSFVGGGESNTASNGQSFVGGGFFNTALGSRSFVGGGESNTAEGYGSFVGGGQNNSASEINSFIGGGNSNVTMDINSFVGGGESNTAEGYGSFVGGGSDNTASGFRSFVGGGSNNTPLGELSFVGGGAFNTASGNLSFVGGGSNLLAKSYSEAVFGTYSTDYTPLSSSSINAADRLFVIGNGTSTSARSNAVTVLKNGNFGIGNEMPEERLHVNGNLIVNQKIQADDSGGLELATDEGASRVFLNDSGRVGIGTNAPRQLLHLSTATTGLSTFLPGFGTGMVITAGTATTSPRPRIYFEHVSAPTDEKVMFMEMINGRLTWSSTNDDATVFVQENILVLESGGNVGLRVADPLHPLHLASGARCTSGGTWMNSSDRRLKTDIAPIGYGLGEVMALRPVSYRMKSNGEEQVGFIAQEVRELLPELVSGTEGDLEKGETLGLSYGNLTAVLVKGMQEQQAEIEELRAANENLRSQLSEMDELKSRMARLEAALSPPAEAMGED